MVVTCVYIIHTGCHKRIMDNNCLCVWGWGEAVDGNQFSNDLPETRNRFTASENGTYLRNFESPDSWMGAAGVAGTCSRLPEPIESGASWMLEEGPEPRKGVNGNQT